MLTSITATLTSLATTVLGLIGFICMVVVFGVTFYIAIKILYAVLDVMNEY